MDFTNFLGFGAINTVIIAIILIALASFF